MLKFETNLELKFNLVGISTRVCKILMKMTKIVTSLNMTLVDINSFFIHLLTIGRDLLLKGEMKIILMEKDPYLFSLPEVNGHFLKQKLISPSLCNNKLPPSAYNLCVVRILPQALTTHWSSIGEAGCPFFRPKFRFPFGILEELSLWSRLLLRSEFRQKYHQPPPLSTCPVGKIDGARSLQEFRSKKQLAFPFMYWLEQYKMFRFILLSSKSKRNLLLIRLVH